MILSAAGDRSKAALMYCNGEPASELSKDVCAKAAEKGLIITTCGTSTLRFAPPLAISESEAEEGMDIGLSLCSLKYVRSLRYSFRPFGSAPWILC